MPRTTKGAERWNKASIIVEAERLTDAVGFDSLSMAGLAARLGIKPPSLYKHFANLDDVRAELQARAVHGLSEVLLHAVAGRSGRMALTAGAQAYYEYLVAHGGARGALASPVPKTADTALRAALQRYQVQLMRVLSDVLLAEGLDKSQCVHALRGLRSLLHGFSALEGPGAFEIPTPTRESFAWVLERYFDGIGLAAKDKY